MIIKKMVGWYENLFDFFSEVHNLTLLQEEINEIIYRVHAESEKIIDESKKPGLPGLKRYWLFTWYEYEANGGFNDFEQSFDSEKEAIETGERMKYDIACDCYQVLDSKTLTFGKDDTFIETVELIEANKKANK